MDSTGSGSCLGFVGVLEMPFLVTGGFVKDWASSSSPANPYIAKREYLLA